MIENELTQTKGISLTENPALKTYQRNAIMSERTNQTKIEIFRLDLLIGN